VATSRFPQSGVVTNNIFCTNSEQIDKISKFVTNDKSFSFSFVFKILCLNERWEFHCHPHNTTFNKVQHLKISKQCVNLRFQKFRQILANNYYEF
jgi:hypothetical protein